MRVRAITSFEDFETLEPVWNRTLEKSGHPRIFLTYEWLSLWWRCHHNRNKNILALVVLDGEEIIGLAPLMSLRTNILGFPIRKLEFISMMNHAFSVFSCSGSLDFIIVERHEEVLNAIFKYLQELKPRWHFMRFHPIAENSPAVEYFSRLAGSSGYKYKGERVFSNPSVDITTDWQTYLKSRPSDLRKKQLKREKDLSKQGPINFKHYISLNDVPNGFNDILAVEKNSWKWKHGLSIDADAYRGFFRLLAELSSNKRWFNLWTLEVGEKIIAYEYHLQYAGVIEGVKTSYDDNYKHYSPGILLIYRMFESIFGSELKKINLMPGNMDYKSKWATNLEDYAEIFIFNNNLYSRILHTILIRFSLYRILRSIALFFEPMPWNTRFQIITERFRRLFSRKTTDK